MNMQLGMAPRPRRRRRRAMRRLFALMLFLLAIFGGIYWFFVLRASTEHVQPYDGDKAVIVYEGQRADASYLLEAEQILLPFDFIKEKIDPAIFWDEPTKSVIVTTKDKVLRMESGEVVAHLNKQPVNLQVPVKEVGGTRYVPLDPLEKLYPFAFEHKVDTGVLTVEQEGYEIGQAKVVSDEEKQPVRVGASHRTPIVAELSAGELVDVLGQQEGYYRVLTASGIAGFLPEKSLEMASKRKVTLQHATSSEGQAAWKPNGEKVNMVWEHVVNKNPNVAQIGALPGVNVVSPTWFELKDAEGTLLNRADPAYVKWAHKRGYQVWGLVTNGFNPDWTQAVLGSYDKRDKLIAQLIHYAHLYDLDGINIDFENVYYEDKERLVQFVRELTPYLHQQGLTVSIDVTIKSNAKTWSMFLDRKALAQVVDYMAVMTYDEHWAASPKAGSVASLPWVEAGLQGVLEEVPNEKLLLGVPFYTRLWTEAKQADGTIKVSSKALSMPRAQEWVQERKLTPVLDEASGQQYVEYRDPKDGNVYKMWLEDVSSMKKRIELVKKYDLAGVASWRRGFEEPEIWPAIEEGLKSAITAQ
ncbi:glycosyl hydrolase family 18 protein [Brevibacillus agri]|uniref:glycosyl hydrolase family 18 protein n=2 Tax=Brevibacillus agri TaxID=51101 RepID=UPI000587D6C2|nr:glycosyl hydrolase family 18 protein [Brevibacillus agri]MBY0053668.1 glycosyl hydrolase [Brevibacillus agri]MED1643662.1 glycosyl hydrolase family 18 protein [Brevibacillus agri]MED1657405.1 glycosyl hydrolase family 18 protein [Brevibacillus agri]MED1688015.1 glycosyl hydrolase family 18 protein [Brevibacillus agri]MED1692222.1 glycosyl hydrolase family 18 protein [Brevibacillus agri]